MVVLIIKEMSYLVVSVFDDLVCLLSHILYNCDIEVFVCAVCFNSAIACKGIMPFPYVIYNLFQ